MPWHHTGTKILIVALALCCPPGTPRSFAQEPSFRVETRLVEVPVVVRDKRSGRAVEGMKAADFVLLGDGKPQKIEYFSVHEMNTSVQAEAKVPRRKDIEIRHRRSFTARSIVPLEGRARDRVLADAIISPLEAVEIGVTAGLAPIAGSDETMLQLTLDPGSVTLAGQAGRYLGRMDLRFVQATVESRVVEDASDAVNLNLALAEADRAYGEGFNYRRRLRIRPDTPTLKIAFCDYVTGRVGSLRVEIPGRAAAPGAQ